MAILHFKCNRVEATIISYDHTQINVIQQQ